MHESAPEQRITIITYIHAKLSQDGKICEPDIFYILEKWLQRHPEYRGRERELRIVRGRMRLNGIFPTDLICVTAKYNPDLAGYDAAEDADLYEYFLAEDCGATITKVGNTWIEQERDPN